jgi:hypothetical protein
VKALGPSAVIDLRDALTGEARAARVTTIFESGERGGPGPNHMSLMEARHNFATERISDPRLKGLTVREPLPEGQPRVVVQPAQPLRGHCFPCGTPE